MSKKEELSEQYRRKAYEVSPTRKRCQHNNEVIAWNNEIVGAFESGWDASKEVVIDKACEWLKFYYTGYLNSSRLGIDIDEMVKDFKMDMKGERKDSPTVGTGEAGGSTPPPSTSSP